MSQSWGSTQVRARSIEPGSLSRTQRSLLAVMAASGTTPTASAHAWAPPSSVTRSAAAPDERVSFHNRAGRTTSSASSSSTMPCC